MEHAKPLTQTEAFHLRFTRQARIARDLINLCLAEVDEALIEHQINTMEPSEALFAQQEARMEAYWNGRSLPDITL